MSEDLNEKIKSILSNPEAMNMISSLLGNSQSSVPEPEAEENDFSDEIRTAVSKINSSGDRRINLLSALKPYMRQNRSDNIDKAIKMLKISQMTSLFKDL